MAWLAEDLRTAFRRLTRAPLFAVSAIGIVALAVGANAAIFAVADAVLFRPLPYFRPDQIFILRSVDAETGARGRPVPIEFIQVIARQHRGISGLGLRSTQSVGSSTGSEPQFFSSISVTPAYLRVLGVAPARGRTFTDDDTAAQGRAAMLSYDTWQRRFGGDEDIIGRSITVGSSTKDIVGVLPRGFVFPAGFVRYPARFGNIGSPDYVTVAREPVQTGNPRTLFPIAITGIVADPVVRLKPGVTRQQAQAELDALVAGVQPGNPRYRHAKPVLESVRSVVFPTGRRIVALLLVSAGFILLLGSVNLAIMLLARARRLQREVGIQLALGATRGRIVRPGIIEAGLIGVGGGIGGLLVASLAFDTLLRQVPPAAYGTAAVGIDLRVVTFAVALGLLSGLLFGAWPAWRATACDVQRLLQGSTSPVRGRRNWLGRPLVTVQVSLAISVLFAAAIAGRTLMEVLRAPLGFSPEHVATFYVNPPDERRPSSVAFYKELIDTLATHVDVVATGAASALPLDYSGPSAPDEKRIVGVDYILPGFLETIGARVRRGRLPTWDDVRSQSRVGVVTESSAQALFPGVDPLGRTMRLQGGVETLIVGVISDVRRSLDADSQTSSMLRLTVFSLAEGSRDMFVVARLRNRRANVLEDLRRRIQPLSPTQPVVATWWSESIDALMPLRAPRFQSLVLGIFAALALTLTALAIFAVVSFAVNERTNELGVRLALGASPESLITMVVRQALLPVAAGTLLGVVLARWVNRLVDAQLVGVHPGSVAVLAVAAATVFVTAAIAAYLPARQASRVDPVTVLRAP